MNAEHTVAVAWANRIATTLVSKVIDGLKGMTDSLLAEEDSGLINTWEEICVQVQDEESVYWDTYVNVVEDLLGAEVQELSREEILALWLITDHGEDWLYSDTDNKDLSEQPPVFQGDIVAKLLEQLLSVASDFENHRTRRFLNRFEDEDEEEDEEDEDEEEDEEDEEDEEENENENDKNGVHKTENELEEQKKQKGLFDE